jgi:hypothetical protein
LSARSMLTQSARSATTSRASRRSDSVTLKLTARSLVASSEEGSSGFPRQGYPQAFAGVFQR